jgi:hypothetical protein
VLTAAELAECQATHEEIMIDTVRLYHSGRIDQQPFDLNLGYEPSDMPEPYYDGKATVQARPIMAGSRTVVEQAKTTLGYAVKLPVTVTGAAPEDLVEVYGSADPKNLGLWLVVQGEESNTFVTARRLSCTLWEGAKRS